MLQILLLRLSAIIFVIVLQFSLGSIFFPTVPAPTLVFNSLVALVLVRGFRDGLGNWLVLVIFADLMSHGLLTTFTFYAIGLAYITSFFSRRFVFEHRGLGLSLLTALATLGVLGYVLLQHLLLPKVGWGIGTLLIDGLVTLLTFPFIFSFFQWFEKSIHYIVQSDFRGLRQA